MNPVRSSPDKHDLAKSSVRFVWTDACFYCLARYQVKIISSRPWTVALTIVIVKGEPSSRYMFNSFICLLKIKKESG